MKRSQAVLVLILAFVVFTGCKQIRYITERYVKNNVETHKEGQQSSIRTYTIYRGSPLQSTRYLEFTGFKYQGNKGLIIGTSQRSMNRKKFKEDFTMIVEYDFTELSLMQAQSILDQYEVLLNKLKSEKVIKNESVYHDFTVSKDIFISFKKTRQKKGSDTMNIWIKGEKYSLPLKQIIKRLKQFVKY